VGPTRPLKWTIGLQAVALDRRLVGKTRQSRRPRVAEPMTPHNTASKATAAADKHDCTVRTCPIKSTYIPGSQEGGLSRSGAHSSTRLKVGPPGRRRSQPRVGGACAGATRSRRLFWAGAVLPSTNPLLRRSPWIPLLRPVGVLLSRRLCRQQGHTCSAGADLEFVPAPHLRAANGEPRFFSRSGVSGRFFPVIDWPSNSGSLGSVSTPPPLCERGAETLAVSAPPCPE